MSTSGFFLMGMEILDNSHVVCSMDIVLGKTIFFFLFSKMFLSQCFSGNCFSFMVSLVMECL